MTDNNNIPISYKPGGYRYGTEPFNLSKAIFGHPLVTNESTPRFVTSFKKRQGEDYWSAYVDGQEYYFGKEGNCLTTNWSLLMAVEIPDNDLEWDLENTPDEYKEVSSFGPREEFAMGALQGILSRSDIDPLKMTDLQMSQAVDKAWKMAGMMLGTASVSKKTHNLRSSTFPEVHNTVGASKTEQLLGDIAKQLVLLNKSLSTDIRTVPNLPNVGDWPSVEETEDDLNENIDDEDVRDRYDNPYGYSLTSLLYLQNRDTSDIKESLSGARIPIYNGQGQVVDYKVVSIADSLKDIRDSLYFMEGNVEKSYLESISNKLNVISGLLKNSDNKSIPETLKDLNATLTTHTGNDATLATKLENIKSELLGIKNSLLYKITISGQERTSTTGDILHYHDDKLQAIVDKLDEISQNLQ